MASTDTIGLIRVIDGLARRLLILRHENFTRKLSQHFDNSANRRICQLILHADALIKQMFPLMP